LVLATSKARTLKPHRLQATCTLAPMRKKTTGGLAPALDSAEPAGDPIGQFIDARRPAGRLYSGPRDHRGTV
jgi:hypothetical protein